MLFIKQADAQYEWIFNLGGVFILGFFSIGFFYWVATRRVRPGQPWRYYLVHYPLFLIISMGLSLHNAVAVIEGLLGVKSPFLRTPKFNVTNARETLKRNVYVPSKTEVRWFFWKQGLRSTLPTACMRVSNWVILDCCSFMPCSLWALPPWPSTRCIKYNHLKRIKKASSAGSPFRFAYKLTFLSYQLKDFHLR